jgi:hypothetical protein
MSVADKMPFAEVIRQEIDYIDQSRDVLPRSRCSRKQIVSGRKAIDSS